MPLPRASFSTNFEEDRERGFQTIEDGYRLLDWGNGKPYNIVHQTLDRHLKLGLGPKTALRYLDGTRDLSWTFFQLARRTDFWAQYYRSQGIQKGDRVFILLPRVPEIYAAILGAIKIGAIVGPLFEGFYEEALRDRLSDSGARLLVSSPDLICRVPRKDLSELQIVQVIEDLFPSVPDQPYEPQPSLSMEGEDGFIIHYTSGSTGKPKGILHAHRAMIQLAITGRWVLDLRPNDVYWCTAHPGWVTGSMYGIFAPWMNGATCLITSGRFEASTWFQFIDTAGVSVWYATPTAFRMLMAAGKTVRERFSLASLRHLLSVGEPLNPEVINWGMETFGVRIHDTWWMTETGAQLIVNLPHREIRPGSMGLPLPGIEVEILDAQNRPVSVGESGQLAIKAPWPSLMKTVWNNREKFLAYFTQVTGFGKFYLSGDTARRDEDGYVYFLGRGDDVIVTAGEKVSPFEVESTLVSHPAVAEAGVIGKPDDLRGNIVKAFVVLREGFVPGEQLARDIQTYVKTRLSAHAYPRELEIVAALPKTRASGKIMRRVLKAWETGAPIGDTTTLDNPDRMSLALSPASGPETPPIDIRE